MKSVFLLFLISSFANAGTISIVGNPNLEFESGETSVEIIGEFDLSNFGNESAVEVFPEIVIGSWRWAGGPEQLVPQGKKKWKISDTVTYDQLGCNLTICKSLNLPRRGLYPIFVWRHYKDLNGYPFTALTVERAVLGQVPKSKQTLLYASGIQGKMSVFGTGEKFEAKVVIRNPGSVMRRGMVSLHTTKEIQIIDEGFPFEIKAGGESEFLFEGKNFSGLLGSVYAIFGVVEWEEEGLRNTQTLSAQWTIREAETTNLWIFVILSMAVLGLVAVLYLRKS